MLISCPECELQVSDKALSCPHCGYPMNVGKSYKKRQSSAKRRRLPNGFGQITELKNRTLRKPFRAMVTVGKDSNGRPIAKLLKPEAYFATYNEAYAALVEYNKNPYDLDSDITVKDVYDKWFEEYTKTISATGIRTITSAWAYCSSVYNMRVKDLRARHIKGVMENGTVEYNGKVKHASANTRSRIKSLFNLMLDYALEYELVDKNYARTFTISDDVINEIEENKQGHMIFSDEEMEILWNNSDKRYVKVILIQCYSGWRPQELGLIKIENVDLEKWTFIGGMKTKAGENRLVPIHPKIREFVKFFYDEAKKIESDFLVNCPDGVSHKGSIKFTYDKYRHRFDNIKKELGLNPDHRAHDGRKHFITMAKRAGVDEYAIKYIVGHAIQDVTEKVYTDRTVTWLINEMGKI